VKDEPSNNDYGHSENSDGKAVTGTYHVVLPDGRKQIVNYKVDANSGYVADVRYESVAYYPVAAPYYRPAVKAYTSAPAPSYSPPVYKVSLQPPPAQKVKEEAVVVKIEPIPVVVQQEEPVVVAKVEPTVEVAVKEETTSAKVESTEPAIEAEEAPATTENVEVVPTTEAAPADPITEATTVAIVTEAITEKIELVEPTKANNKRSYQRSWTSLSQPRYYAGRIRKRQPLA